MTSDRREEFEIVALAHTEALMRVAWRTTGDYARAEDVVQETMLSAWRSFQQFEHGTNCRAWLFKIMFHVISKAKQRSTQLPIVELSDGEGLDNLVCIGSQHIGYSDVLASVNRLPDDQRSVIVLAAVEGFSCREISVILTIPIGTVMSRLSRARAELRRLLRRVG